MQSDEIDLIGWQRRIDKIEELIGDGHPTEAVTRISSAFENLLKMLYGRIAVRLPPQTVKEVGETLGRRAVGDLGLGGLYGLFRTCKLFEHIEGERASELVRILNNHLPELTALRNESVHGAAEASETDAQLLLLQLKRALEYAGSIVPARSSEGGPNAEPSTAIPPPAKASPSAPRARPLRWVRVALILITLGIIGVFLLSWWSPGPATLPDPGPVAVPPDSSKTPPVVPPPPDSGDAPPTVRPAPVAPPKERTPPQRGSRLGSSRDPKCAALEVKLAQGQLLSSSDEAFRAKNCRGS
jgi:hypothetical protein